MNNPSVNADEGYVFDHWENQNNEVVDENTVFNRGDSIRPVFKKIVYENFTITKENREKVGYVSGMDVLNIPETFYDEVDDKYYKTVAIADYAFQYTVVNSVIVPDSVKTFGEYAFQSSELTAIKLPKNLNSIPGHCFSGAINLLDISIPSTVTTIGKYAFSNCRALKTIIIPNSVTSMGDCTLMGCTALTSVQFSSNCPIIPENCCGSDFNLTTVKIPNGVTKISDFSFQNCAMTSITMPGTLREIGQACFLYCKNLTSVSLNSGLKTIGLQAFKDLPITRLSVPSSVTSIGERAFNKIPTVVYSGTATGLPWGASNVIQ